MINRNKLLTKALLCISLLLGSSVFASEFGTSEEARSMLERVVEAMKSDKDAALKAFTEGTDGFKDRDLYVTCFELGGRGGLITAYGGVGDMIGRSGYDLIDKNGTNMGELLDNDTQGEVKTVTYWWPRPGSEEPVEKESYYTTIGDTNCLVGYYK